MVRIFRSHLATNFMNSWHFVVASVFGAEAISCLLQKFNNNMLYKYQKYSSCYMLLIHISLFHGTIGRWIFDSEKKLLPASTSSTTVLWIERAFIFLLCFALCLLSVLLLLFCFFFFIFLSIMKHILRLAVLKVINGRLHAASILRELLLDAITWLTTLANIGHIYRKNESKYSPHNAGTNFRFLSHVRD